MPVILYKINYKSGNACIIYSDVYCSLNSFIGNRKTLLVIFTINLKAFVVVEVMKVFTAVVAVAKTGLHFTVGTHSLQTTGKKMLWKQSIISNYYCTNVVFNIYANYYFFHCG